MDERPRFRKGDYAQLHVSEELIKEGAFSLIFDVEVLEGPNSHNMYFVTGIGVTRPGPVWIPEKYLRDGNLVQKHIARRSGTLTDKAGKKKQYASAHEAAKDVLKG